MTQERMNVLAIAVVSISASATIQSKVTLKPEVKRVTIIPAGTVYMAMDEAATSGKAPLTAGAGYEIGITSKTDLRLYAAAPTNVTIVQEG